MSPVETVIAKFGGPSRVADLLGIDRSNVTHWRKQARGGRIPGKWQEKLLKLAPTIGVDLKPEDLVVGAKTPSALDGIAAADAARAAETERCLRICEVHAGNSDPSYARAARAIAYAISKGTPR
jgi:hypothetical protein